MKLSSIDIAVLFLYFFSQVAIGLYVGRKNKSTDQYFLGGKSFSGLIIGISFIGSVISSSTFLAIPADSFKTAWLRFIPNLAFPIVTLMAAWLLVPFFRRGTISSAYQYLALRFGPSLSIYASLVFILSQMLRTSMIAYLLSLLVGEITGWGFTNSLLLIVGVTALYTVKGGIKAVIWTDVVQTFVLLLGGVICIGYVILHIPGGISQIFQDAIAHNKLSFSDLNAANELVPTDWFGGFSEKTVFMLFFVGCIQFLNLQFDQSTVQRWCTARTARDARKSMYILGLGALPVWALFQFIGVALFVFFLHNPDPFATGVLNGTYKAERILPHFIMTQLSGGLAGLVIAGAFAAGMSTLSACINVSSMVSTDDLYKKYLCPDSPDHKQLALGKMLSLTFALAMTGGALFIHHLDMVTLTDFMLMASVVLSVGIPSVFIAGMFTRRITTPGVWAGLTFAIILSIWVMLGNANQLPEFITLQFPTYYLSIIGNLGAITVALVVSLWIKSPTRDLTNLTVWDQAKTPLE